MNKISALFKLKAQKKENNLLVKEQRYIYIINRLLRIFNKLPYFTMGETLKKPIIVKNSYGLFYCRDRTFDLHIISDTYEYNVRKIIEKLSKKSKIIIDVEANIGKYSILASKSNPHAKVFAIEPEKENFEVLEKNKILNNCKNLELIKVALNDKNQKVKLYKAEVNKGGHSLKYSSNSRNFEIVEGKKFEDIFTNKIKKVDLMKIDAEGAELEILKGTQKFLKEKKIKNIIIELNDLETRKFLESFGYSFEKIMYNNFLVSIK